MSTDNPKFTHPLSGMRLEEGSQMQFPWPHSTPRNIAFWDSRFFVIRIDPYILYGRDRGYRVHAVVNSPDHGPTHGFPPDANTSFIPIPEYIRYCKTMWEARDLRRELQRFTPILDPDIRISDSWPPSKDEFEEWRVSQKLRHPLPGRIDHKWPERVHQIFHGEEAEQVKRDSEGHCLVPNMRDLVITESACYQWGYRLVQLEITPNDYLLNLEREHQPVLRKPPVTKLPWAVVTYDEHVRLTGHVMERRTSREDIAIRGGGTNPGGIPDQFLTLEIQSKDALERNRERSPIFENLWQFFLQKRDPQCMWLCLPDKSHLFHPSKELPEREAEDESIIHRIAMERGTCISRIHQKR